MFGQIIFYIFGTLFLLAAIIFGVMLFKIVKNPRVGIDKKLFLIALISAGIGIISFTSAMAGVYGFINEAPSFIEVLSGVGGAFIFSISLFTLSGSFVIHYYRKGLQETFDKILYILILVSFPILIISFFISSNGYADYLTYPLINGLSFADGWVTPKGGKPSIAFYAICILSGALFVYFLCDHKMYKQYGKHGLLESTFFVAFPAGIIGARIFYVVGNYTKEFANQEWWKVFAINDGGLTILGGAITGIVVGVLWFLWKRRQYSIWIAVDIILPTILIAQAVGRWGNFFNCEVHGLEVDPNLLWWMPKVVVNNAIYSSTQGLLGGGNVYLPLFYIEACLNLLGYVILGEILPRFFKKQRELGDVAFGYLVWYGLVRTLLEPLRHPTFNMGEDGYWSWIWSIMFIVIGALLIGMNHLIRFLIRRKKDKEFKQKTLAGPLTFSIIITVIAFNLLINGIILMVNNPFSLTLAFSPFNIGIFLTCLGASFLLMLLTSVPYVVSYYEKRI